MKTGVFILTKNEQRVIILTLVALLAAAFVRYWYNAKSFSPNRSKESISTTSAVPLDETPPEGDESAGERDKTHQAPSPQSSP